MSLRVPYRKYPSTTTPGGFYYAASLAVSIARAERNAPRSKRFDAIIDSGASGCLFHASIGRAVGLEIEKGQRTQTLGVAGATYIFQHDVMLHVPGGPVLVRAGFSEDLPIAGLLGMSGFFEHFRVVFDPDALDVELDRVYRA